MCSACSACPIPFSRTHTYYRSGFTSIFTNTIKIVLKACKLFKLFFEHISFCQVKPDSPAASKGLIEGQILLQVNGKDIQELSFEEIVFLIHNG